MRSMDTLTRAEIAEAINRKLGLSRTESLGMVESILGHMSDALASGSVNFSDGQMAAWTLDQYGRLGLSPAQQGYRPPPEDFAEFQALLEKELVKLGI